MTMSVVYASKKALKEAVGKPLRYNDDGPFPSYTPNGKITVAGRPHLTSIVKREFYAEVTMENGLIKSVK
jgi:hypothetical protein